MEDDFRGRRRAPDPWGALTQNVAQRQVLVAQELGQSLLRDGAQGAGRDVKTNEAVALFIPHALPLHVGQLNLVRADVRVRDLHRHVATLSGEGTLTHGIT